MDERQVRHFELWASGASVSAIARQTHHDRDTVCTDLAMEGRRRATEMAAQRQMHIAASIHRCNAVISRALIRGEAARRAGIELRSEIVNGAEQTYQAVKDTQAVRAANDSDKLVLMATRHIDRLLGLEHESDIPPAASVPAPQPHPLVVFIQNIVDPERRLAVLEEFDRQATLAGVVPAPRRSPPR